MHVCFLGSKPKTESVCLLMDTSLILFKINILSIYVQSDHLAGTVCVSVCQALDMSSIPPSHRFLFISFKVKSYISAE